MPEQPSPLEHAECFARSFAGFANELAMMFGGPIYLVGSYLTSLSPGDIDLRLQLDRETCVLYWGEDFGGPSREAPRGWLARKREELKQSRRMTRVFGRGRTRIDFQFQSTLFKDCDALGNGIAGEPIMKEGKPSLRLDAVPWEIFAAGRGDP
jgi:hypothetical protein